MNLRSACGILQMFKVKKISPGAQEVAYSTITSENNIIIITTTLCWLEVYIVDAYSVNVKCCFFFGFMEEHIPSHIIDKKQIGMAFEFS